MTAAYMAIESRVLKWSPARRITLAERLLESVEDFASERIENDWRREIARRVRSVESGGEKGISSRRVFADARKKLHEARKLSSSRAK